MNILRTSAGIARFSRQHAFTVISSVLFTLTIAVVNVYAQTTDVSRKLKGFDKQIEQILKDWNVPGCGIGIVMKNELVFAKGYGFRNLDEKLPVTPGTLFQIASNTKLFTATSIGMLVEEGKLEWDKPVRNYIPQIEYYNNELNANVTIRDMLSHRTGISRHDGIWYYPGFTRKEIFDRIIYLEPSIPLRQGYLYNNIMYIAAGQIVELLSGQTWEDFVRTRIFDQLNMTKSLFCTEEMQKQPDFMAPYYEKRDTDLLLPRHYFTNNESLGSAGSIISSISDLSNWLIAQLNNGRFNGKQVIPSSVIRETMMPAMPNSSVPEKYFENLNSVYGMGRSTSSYKGHYLSQHGGSIGGIYSSISVMPADSMGVIVFTNRVSQLPGIISYIIYDRLLDLPKTPWSERALTDYQRSRETSKEARKNTGTDRIPDTNPSHPLTCYAGTFEDQAYGCIEITATSDKLHFKYYDISLPLNHYHYDRFVTDDHEVFGKWSLTFSTDAQGSIHQAKISLDEKEVVFTRKADPALSDPKFLRRLEGRYELNGSLINIVFRDNTLVINTAPPRHLVPYKDNIFRVREFSDQTAEFIFDPQGTVTALRITADGIQHTYKRKQ